VDPGVSAGSARAIARDEGGRNVGELMAGVAVRVEVTDSSGPGVPELAPVARDAEGGRGLQLVTGLASRWGWRRCGGRTMTWFEIQALLQPMQHSAVPGKGLNSPDVEVPGS
jgi:hypothetical protein